MHTGERIRLRPTYVETAKDIVDFHGSLPDDRFAVFSKSEIGIYKYT